MFGFLKKRTVYKLRKRYDRIREKADKLPRGVKRNSILTTLDQVTNTLVMLEEQRVSLIEKRRMVSYIKKGIARAKDILEDKNQVPYPPYAQYRRNL
jgi:hypothetical protein